MFKFFKRRKQSVLSAIEEMDDAMCDQTEDEEISSSLWNDDFIENIYRQGRNDGLMTAAHTLCGSADMMKFRMKAGFEYEASDLIGILRALADIIREDVEENG